MSKTTDSKESDTMSITAFNGPFPTDWEPPERCTALTQRGIVGLDFAPSCLPESFIASPGVVYSPGTGCPSGYTAPAPCTKWTDAITTTITCCPVRGDLTLSCVPNDRALSLAWKDKFCTWSAGDKKTVLLVTTERSGTTSTRAVTMTGKAGVNAYGLRMVYQESDLPKSTTAGETSATRTGETGAATETGGDDSAGSGGGLSTGAKAAIGVVIPLVAIAILVGAFFFIRRRRRARDGPNELPAYGAGNEGAGADSKTLASAHSPAPPLATGGGYAAVPQELQGTDQVVELPGDVSHLSPPPQQSSLSPSPPPQTSVSGLSSPASAHASTASPEVQYQPYRPPGSGASSPQTGQHALPHS
ncbi:transmembrane alpha-helix domain-containing protein [Purpureocillium lilacinum]|uniref:Transmembrane alpha-helix domain-containing protein n=1 Tax=Purpureocillium lilacinum TaxID=33203 RepID=A0A179H064_PURLI|nr:transmembrane alpha-helix domain-containing protein [Purpureocillium lilacinum]